MGGVFGQHASAVTGLGLLPFCQSRGDFFFRDTKGERVIDGVNCDGVSVFYDGQRAAVECLGSDVTDHETVRAAGEASVGDERDILAETASHHGTGGGKHFAHAGSAARSLVADDDHVAFF